MRISLLGEPTDQYLRFQKMKAFMEEAVGEVQEKRAQEMAIDALTDIEVDLPVRTDKVDNRTVRARKIWGRVERIFEIIASEAMTGHSTEIYEERDRLKPRFEAVAVQLRAIDATVDKAEMGDGETMDSIGIVSSARGATEETTETGEMVVGAFGSGDAAKTDRARGIFRTISDLGDEV